MGKPTGQGGTDGCPSLFCARRGSGSCARRMGFTLALTNLSLRASRRRRRSQAGRDTMLPRQSQRVDTDDTDATDPTDRNGPKAVGAACVYPCPLPRSVGDAASPGSSGEKTGCPATALRVAAAALPPSLLGMTWDAKIGRTPGTDPDFDTDATGRLYFFRQAHSSSGPGCSPLKAKTRVRTPYGPPAQNPAFAGFFVGSKRASRPLPPGYDVPASFFTKAMACSRVVTVPSAWASRSFSSR